MNMDAIARPTAHIPRPRVTLLPLHELDLAIRRVLECVPLAAWRMGLASGGREVPLTILRGAFGAALHDLSDRAYQDVFRPEESEGSPAYLLRRSAHRLPDRSIFELVLFGRALEHLEVILQALQLAGERGLGRDRRAFAVERLAWLDPWARPCRDRESEGPFELDLCSWPLAGDPAHEPCRIFFPEPVRILRRDVLIKEPSLRDLVAAGCRRLAGLVDPGLRLDLKVLQETGLVAADTVASQPFVGSCDSVGRWSATQQRYIELQGVSGHLDLPDGPGQLWRLLAAMQWIHCGKATVVGLGRLVVLPIW